MVLRDFLSRYPQVPTITEISKSSMEEITTRKLIIDDRHFMTDSRQNGLCHKIMMDS